MGIEDFGDREGRLPSPQMECPPCKFGGYEYFFIRQFLSRLASKKRGNIHEKYDTLGQTDSGGGEIRLCSGFQLSNIKSSVKAA